MAFVTKLLDRMLFNLSRFTRWPNSVNISLKLGLAKFWNLPNYCCKLGSKVTWMHPNNDPDKCVPYIDSCIHT